MEKVHFIKENVQNKPRFINMGQPNVLDVVEQVSWFNDHVVAPRALDDEELRDRNIILKELKQAVCEEQDISFRDDVFDFIPSSITLGRKSSKIFEYLVEVQERILSLGVW
ncbi:hypothetical protein COW81_00785 [Candidatus Campbellbacteria bacterium CG22_combo_CG10-13_8_21_14_all_36_13]|uniref:Uncharacterized protein n=1 Tax=Candidatus Campbellbacteria bacterium CG22_combo_CG10-13_8_21_14_all_36_13 TaxID=1974529 RepID=A0A2H0E0I4_9BACT|nr:MAG: hypothetical protein COW81_00785 [Candidatus Campbellbacteria bacterium CG22_combo_CG10-13_8_21_14_all_36_13]